MPPKKMDATSTTRGTRETIWAIKKPDGEPLLRNDLQFEVLTAIFNDREIRFRAPLDPSKPPGSPPVYLTFDQLFLEALLSGNRTNAAMRQKLIDHRDFGTNFCKLALLINIGRINTTLSFYPTMKTALRTYHPVPALQTEEIGRKEMQDAPRIKAMLKACYLAGETHNNQPVCLKDIAKKAASMGENDGPPTTAPNVLFQMFNEATWVSEKYFPTGFDLHDIFYPSFIPSAARAKAFLILLHHILEDRDLIRDFDAPGRRHPALLTMPPPDPTIAQHENIDTPEELQYVAEMKALRADMTKNDEAMQRREELMSLRGVGGVQHRLEEKERQEAAAEPTKKKRKLHDEPDPIRSFAKAANFAEGAPPEDLFAAGWEEEDWSETAPLRSTVRYSWEEVRQDMLVNRDPDYDSDREEAWPYDLLVRRMKLRFPMVNPDGTVSRVLPKDHPSFDELFRRREQQVAEDMSAAAGARAAAAAAAPDDEYTNETFDELAMD